MRTVDFVLGMVLVFVPIDVIQEVNGDQGVLVYTGLVLALIVWIRRRIARGAGGKGLVPSRARRTPEGDG